MADGGATAFMAVAALAAVASTGVSIYSASEQSKSQAAIAEYNRMANEQNAAWQRMAAERAAQAEQFNAQIAMFNAEAQADQANMNNVLVQQQSAQLRAQADSEDRQARDQADRIRQEKDRILGLQRSQYAKAGVTYEGSPLAVLADTAQLYEMQAADTKLLANLSSEKKRYEAEMNSLVGGFNLNADLFASTQAKKASQLSFADAQFAEKAAGAGYRINMRQAAIEQMAGNAQARGTMTSGYASALSNLSSAAYYGSGAVSGFGSPGTNSIGQKQLATNTVPRATAVR
jgi:hypothetical protein